MKKLVLIVAAALMAVACNSTKTYVIEGKINGFNGEVSIVNSTGEEVYGTATTAEDGTFSLTIESATNIFANLALNGEVSMPVFVDGSPITISGEYENTLTFVAAGTVANEAYADYNGEVLKLVEPLMDANMEEASEEDIFAIFAQMQVIMSDSYEANKDNLWGAYLLTNTLYQSMTANEILETIGAYPKDIQNIEEVKAVVEYANKVLKTDVGQKYINITLPNVEGEEVSLSDVIEANKVVLIDFWASWCSPCMGEMPYLLEAYATYHDKGFEIYGVSLDESNENWKKAIETQGMKWVNVSDVTGWQTSAAQEYSVNSIPTNFLVNAEGEIIAKNLRGEALLEELNKLFE